MKKSVQKYDYLFVLCVITFVVAVYSPLNPFTVKGITTDQAVFFTIAKGLLNGKLAYVDFFDHKGILLYMILAAGLWVSKNLIGNFMIELTVIFSSAFFMYRIARLFAGKWISLLAVATIFASDITLFTSSNSEEYIYPLLCISVYLFLLQLRDGIKTYQVFIIGACGMLVFFIKYNYCLIWAALGILLFVHMISKRRHVVEIMKMCLAFGGGMAAATAPFALYLLVTGSFGAFMETYVLYSLHYAEFTGAAERMECIRFLLNTPLSIYFYLWVFGYIILALYSRIKKEMLLPEIDRKQLEMSIYVVLLSIAILAVTSSPGQSWYYYKQATMLIYVIPLSMTVSAAYGVLYKICKKTHVCRNVSGKNNKCRKWQNFICSGAVTLLVILSIGSRLTPKYYKIVPDARFAGAMKMCELIGENCGEGDKMISFSNDCTMYFYSECEPASRIFFPSAAIVEDALIDELMRDLEQNKPKILTFQSDWEAGLTERMKEAARTFTAENYSLLYEDKYHSMYLRNE